MKETYPNILQTFGLFGLFILVNIVGGFAVYGLGSFNQSIAALIGMCIANGLLILIALNFKKANWSYLFSGNRPAGILIYILSALFAVFFILTMDPIISSIPMPDSFKDLFEELIKRDIWSFLAVTIAAPITEELIFRRLILTGLEKNYGAVQAILWSAFFFALFHLNPWQGISAFAIGIFLGWLYLKTGDIWLCIFVHFFNNSISYMAFYLSDDAFFSLVDLVGYNYRLALLMGMSTLCMYFCYKFLNRQFKLTHPT